MDWIVCRDATSWAITTDAFCDACLLEKFAIGESFSSNKNANCAPCSVQNGG